MGKNKIKRTGFLLLAIVLVNNTLFSNENSKSKQIAGKENSKSEEKTKEEKSSSKEIFEVRKDINEIPEANKRIGLALGGGSAKGLAHIGILKVMEEEKVPIEYVTGTSMGSIIGGLYAAGYNAKEIEQIAIEMDWLQLFNDMISRKEKGITRNLIEDTNVTTLPMSGLVPKLPSGAVGGKSASEKLNELLFGTLGTQDFKNLPKKFAAVATDLNTGEGVMIDKGSLATAIRSSLSLPSIFNPMQVEDRLYVDGGVVRNLPVQDVKVLGADYTIGINVGEGFEKREFEKLNVIGVISDSMTIAGRQEVERQIRMLDMYIAPDLANVQSYEFMKAKDIINMGEKVARNNIEEIRKLSNPTEFDRLEEKRLAYRNSQAKEYHIANVKVKGNQKYERKYFDKYLPKNLGKMTEKDLKEIVNDLYRNGNFSTVYYEIEDGNTLVINVQEKAGNYLSVSTSANNEDMVSARLGIQGNKTLINNIDTRYELNFLAGNEYGVNGAAIMSSGKDNRLLAVGKMSFKRDLIKNQNYNGQKYDFENQKGKISIGIGAELNRTSMFLLSGGYQVSDVKDNLYEDENRKVKFPYLEAEFTHDDRDSITFPKKGSQVKAVYTIADSSEADFNSLYTKAEINIPLNNKLTLTPSVTYATSKGDSVPETYRPKLGGFRDSDYSLELAGVPMDSLRANSIFTGKIKLQYQFNRLLFGDINATIARLSDKKYDFGNDKYESYGIGLGAKTPVGPFYFGLAKTPEKSIRYFLNLGYTVKGFNED